MAAIDRIEALRQRDDIVGIDFVYVKSDPDPLKDQRTLYIFFHPSATLTAQQILGTIQPSQVSIFSPSGGEWLPEVSLNPASPPAWATVDGRRVLRVVTAQPGDFSRYKFRLDHPLVDPYFQETGFSFKANCPSQLDCETGPRECPEEELVDYPVNYQARDFWSIRQALLDFASERHPAWKDRLEADLGMMLAEVMSAMGDEFSYYQDRIAREGSFETATQRRSVRRHARMVDFHLHNGKGGTTWLDLTVDASQPVHVIPVGLPVWVRPPSVQSSETAQSRQQRSPSIYEVGYGLAQGHSLLSPALGVMPSQSALYKATSFNVRNGANEIAAYQWDENDACLLAASTSLDLAGHHAADLPLEDFTDPDVPGKWVVLQTDPVDSSVPARRWLVRLIRVTEATDPLTAANITRIVWEKAQATPFDMEYETLVLRGNIVPATAGQTLEAFFQIEGELDASVLPPTPLEESSFAIEREAPPVNQLPADTGIESYRSSFLFSLPGSEERDLISQGTVLDTAAPEVRLMDGEWVAGLFVPENEWEWKRALLGGNSSLPGDKHFTLDDGSWRRVAGYRRVDESGTPQEFIHKDYAGGRGATIRFGNGEFGETPARGTCFRAVYRLGRGRGDNIAADSLTDFNPALLPFLLNVTNPFGVTDAVDPQTEAEARQLAPEAFRQETFRAVRAEDYAAAVEKLDWVQRAGAQFRWTGSWLTLFATPDPKERFRMSGEQRLDLERQLDRYRLAGRETHAMNPKFANLDLEIRVCVAPTSYRGEVKQAVLEALFGKPGFRAAGGFFLPDNWTFGVPLERARLEAAIQAVPGVRAVEEIRIRRRGRFAMRLFDELVYAVAPDEIIRVENNHELPERGAVRLIMEGGA